MKYIKNLKYDKFYDEKLTYIFDKLLTNNIITVRTKISFLKMINKNKINIIDYDIVNKLINLEYGDEIILEFNKDENSLFNTQDYKNDNYIINIIKYLNYNLDLIII